jgi:F-type H+-transporting ATPase subunit epsilon
VPDKYLSLEIVTPEKVAYDGFVQSFSAPGTIGSFQILYNHAALLSSLRIGEIKIVDRKGEVIRFATSGGFVDVRNNRIVTLAETVERFDQIDVERAAAARDRALKRLSEKVADLDIPRARAALARAMNRLHIAGR